MKRIGLIGGTSWPSTMEYYRLLNEYASRALGGHHSANLLLYNIDYHEIKSSYATWEKVPALLKREIEKFLTHKPESLIICNNTLHKAFDSLAMDVNVPVFHAVDLTVKQAQARKAKKVLLLATKFTMEDPYFMGKLAAGGIEAVIPDDAEREQVQAIQSQLATGAHEPEHDDYFTGLIAKYAQLDAVILACTELPLAISAQSSDLPIINPLELQCRAAIEWALG